MKKILLSLVLLASCLALRGQVVYTDASAFPLYGKAAPTEGYRRLPASLEGVVRDALWALGRNSAGLYVRFRTDAPEIHARWSNTGYHMPHMTDVGTGGLDLYAHLDGQWKNLADENWTTAFALANEYKDLGLCERLAAEAGFTMPGMELAKSIYQKGMDAGIGAEDWRATYKVVRGDYDA